MVTIQASPASPDDFFNSLLDDAERRTAELGNKRLQFLAGIGVSANT
jgi:hypothetical protein